MQRTINYTGRKKIHRKDVQISMRDGADSVSAFDVDCHFAKRGFPTDASVYVEAYRGNTVQRFDFGTVGHMRTPADTRLTEIDVSGPALFRIRVVDEAGKIGRLIATADGLRPFDAGDQENKSSLLVVRSYPLGEQTWRVEFETGGKPELCINNRIPDAIGQIKNNRLFQSLVLPAALRHVLMYFLWNDEDDNPVADQWFRFAEVIHAERPHERDPNVLLSWVDEVVTSFSDRFNLCENLLLKMEDGSA